MSKFMSRERASELIPDGATVVLTGSGGSVMDADYVYEAVETRFLTAGHPKGLTLIHITGIGNWKEQGISRFAHTGMTKRVIGGHWAWSPTMIQMAINNEIEAYNLPQGVLSLLTREIAARRTGLLTPVGLQTFVDPRVEGGKLNRAAKENLVEVQSVNGADILFYPAFPIDVAIIRGSTADEDGNISVELEAVNLDILSAAQAAYNSGGIVIAQVKRTAPKGSLNPRMARVPGFMVNAVVVYPDQWQTSEGEYNPSFSGEKRVPLDSIETLEFNIRKVIARRAAMELKPGLVVNLGFGISDGVANIAAEEKIIDRFTFTVEQGIVGGVPAKGDIFGAGWNPDLIVDAPYQFDFYHGGGLDLTCLGMAQVDVSGNVNVSKFGNRIAGCGGFIDISQNTKTVVFCSTFTTSGLRVKISEGKVQILQEGRVKKFIKSVEQITFSGNYALEHDQNVLYVTERAVFQLTGKGLQLIEIAPGIDIETDILPHMEFNPVITDDLKLMDSRIFQSGPMSLINDRNWK